MQLLSVFLKISGGAIILIGLLHLFLGPQADVLLGAASVALDSADPVIDSQNRFYGVIFAGFGAMLILCATDLRKYQTLFDIFCLFFWLGGAARFVSYWATGLPTITVIGLTVIEILGTPLLYFWYRKTLANLPG